jgi:hypothetical protein
MYFLFFIMSLLYWGYTVTFTKVLTIYHNWIYSLHHSPLSLLPPFLEQFQQVLFFHFHIWVHDISTTFTHLHRFLWGGYKERVVFVCFVSFFIIIVLLFICAYKAWVISSPCPHPLLSKFANDHELIFVMTPIKNIDSGIPLNLFNWSLILTTTNYVTLSRTVMFWPMGWKTTAYKPTLISWLNKFYWIIVTIIGLCTVYVDSFANMQKMAKMV